MSGMMPLHGSHMASHPASECRDLWSTREPAGKGPGFLGLGSGLINFYPDPDMCPTLRRSGQPQAPEDSRLPTPGSSSSSSLSARFSFSFFFFYAHSVSQPWG